MVNADVKLLVREALEPIFIGSALMKQVRDERDNARAKVRELEHEGRLAAKTINHLAGRQPPGGFRAVILERADNGWMKRAIAACDVV